MSRAYYSNSINQFVIDDSYKILGELSKWHSHSLEDSQKNAWIEQINILKSVLAEFKQGHIYFEFSIPRMGKRVDNILIVNGIIFVLEFKTNAKTYEKYAIDQTMDYALDLKNFHEGSHFKHIVPILVATEASNIENQLHCN